MSEETKQGLKIIFHHTKRELCYIALAGLLGLLIFSILGALFHINNVQDDTNIKISNLHDLFINEDVRVIEFTE